MTSLEMQDKDLEMQVSKNVSDDTALRVAERAGDHISTLKRLLDALPLPSSENPEEALKEILVRNNQGNTFFHEALLNSYKSVLNVFYHEALLKNSNDQRWIESFKTQEYEADFKGLVELATLFCWLNNEGKSLLHLAIEEGYKDIVDHALTKLISPNPPSDNLIIFRGILHREAASIISKIKPPLPEKDQGSEMENLQRHMTELDFLRRLAELRSRRGRSSLTVDVEMKKKTLVTESSKYEISQKLSEYSTTNCSTEVRLLIMYDSRYVPPGTPLLIVAILKQEQGILETILSKKKEWIHLKDEEGRNALHYAASIGYVKGVESLLESNISCSMERDNDGFVPLHFACAGGQVQIVDKLLKHCPDPSEILDKYGKNIAHIAAESGKYNVVRFILKNPELVKLINDKDVAGNTPLHLATLRCRPKIVYALTWDPNVELHLINKNNQTALDALLQIQQDNPPLQQRLTFLALKSAGVQQYAKRRSSSIIKVPLPPPSVERIKNQKAPNMDLYKDRINTLMLVSTLITTVTFAAGFTLPGGVNSSDPGQGMALMLNRVWFQLFIFSITISMYGAISVIIILIWAQLGDITMTLLSLKVAMPLLGVTLATLSLAFLAGVHLVITDLNWLATTFLVMCVIFILMLLLLYTLHWFPSSSSIRVIRYISYYPFLFLTWLAEPEV